MPDEAETSPSHASRRPQWTPPQILQAVKEIVTAVIGLLIVMTTLVLAVRTFGHVGTSPEAVSDAKDVLTLIMGLTGVVIGYYFGRVPAEAQATQAQLRAEQAVRDADQMAGEVERAADNVDAVLGRLSPGMPEFGTSRSADPGAGSGAAVNEIERVRDDLRAAAARARRRG
jgi:hypothetical protein